MMKFFQSLLLAGGLMAAVSAPLQAVELSVQGLKPGISFAQTVALLGLDYVYSIEAKISDMPAVIYTAIKSPNEGFALFYLNDHLEYLQYEVFYPQGAMPNLDVFKQALSDKYGDNSHRFHWRYGRDGKLMPGDAAGCDIAGGRADSIAFHHRGDSNLTFSIPKAWNADCYSHVDVMIGMDETNPKLVAWYQVVMANEGIVTDFLTAQAAEEKKDTDAQTQSAKKNVPKL